MKPNQKFKTDQEDIKFNNHILILFKPDVKLYSLV